MESGTIDPAFQSLSVDDNGHLLALAARSGFISRPVANALSVSSLPVSPMATRVVLPSGAWWCGSFEFWPAYVRKWSTSAGLGSSPTCSAPVDTVPVTVTCLTCLRKPVHNVGSE